MNERETKMGGVEQLPYLIACSDCEGAGGFCPFCGQNLDVCCCEELTEEDVVICLSCCGEGCV